MSDIVERLRDTRGYGITSILRMCDEAAARIAELEAENARLKELQAHHDDELSDTEGENVQLENDLLKAAARIAKLEAALRLARELITDYWNEADQDPPEDDIRRIDDALKTEGGR